MSHWRRRENPLSAAEQAIKWKPLKPAGTMRTWGTDDLPNGCGALLGADDRYGPRGGVYALYGVAVFAPDGTVLMDRSCGYRRWACIRAAYAVAERWMAAREMPQLLEAAE